MRDLLNQRICMRGIDRSIIVYNMPKRLSVIPSRAMFIFLFLSLGLSVYSQSGKDSVVKSPFSVNFDVVSRYIWRALPSSQSPAFQPSVGYSNNGFSFGTWGSYTFAKEAIQEVDLYVGYSKGRFSLTINDYYSPIDTVIIGDYFEWDAKKSRHVIEPLLTIDGPLAFQLVGAIMLYGNDRDMDGDNNYSTYFELNKIWSKNGITVKPYIAITTGTGYYSSDGLQVVNAGIDFKKSCKINSDFQLPVGVNFITNPYKKTVFLVLSVSF